MRYAQRISVIIYYLGLLISWNISQPQQLKKKDIIFIVIAILTNSSCLGVNYFISHYVIEVTTKLFYIKMTIVALPLIIFCYDDTFYNNDPYMDFYKKISLLLFGLELSNIFRHRAQKSIKKVRCKTWIGILTLLSVTIRKGVQTLSDDWILFDLFINLLILVEVVFVLTTLHKMKQIPIKSHIQVKRKSKRASTKKDEQLQESRSLNINQALVQKRDSSQTQVIVPRQSNFKYEALYNLQTPFSINQQERKNIIVDSQFNHESASIKWSPPKQPFGFDFQEVTQQRNFYKSLFNQFPDGMIILGENSKIEYINICTKKLLKTKARSETVQKLLQLKNCQSKFLEQAQFLKLFQVLNSKLSSNTDFKYPSQFENLKSLTDEINEDNDQEEQEQSYQKDVILNMETFMSVNATVQEEYSRAIIQLQLIALHSQNCFNVQLPSSSQLVSSQNNHQYKQFDAENRGSIDGSPQYSKISTKAPEKIKFLYEIKMLCMDTETEEESSFSEGEKIEKQQSSILEKQSCKLLEITLKPYLFENHPQVLIMIKDVSLFNQISVLEQVNQNKSKMLYYVAHEFRNPLSTIILTNEALLEKYESDEKLCSQYFQPVLSTSRALLSLVNDLLDLAQLKAGKFKITNKVFNLKDHIYDIAKMQSPSVAANGLYLKLIVDNLKQSTIKSDPDRIRQIVINLIGNAIKFTQTGGITLEVQNKGSNLMEIKVQDTGIGICKDDQNKLFQEFGKLEDKSQMNAQGVGLGLMISHIMAQKLGSMKTDEENIERQGLKVESEGVGMGCCFSFDIYNHQIEDQLSNQSENEIEITPTIKQNEFSVSSSFIRADNSRKVTYTFHVNKNIEKFNQQSTLGNSTIIKSKLQSMYKSDAGSKMRIQGHSKFQLMIPKVFGESKDDFSPKDLDHKFSLPEHENQFKQCGCAEILIVDDQKFNIDTLLMILSKYCLKIEYALSCDKAIQYLQEKQQSKCCEWIKIILMDIEMPLKNGLQTTQEIRALELQMRLTNDSFQDSFILGLSGHGDKEQRAKCLKVGMNDLIMKPLRPKEFISVVQQQIKKNLLQIL